MFKSEALAHHARKQIAESEAAIADGRLRGPAKDESLHHIAQLKEMLISVDASVAKLYRLGVTLEQYDAARKRLGFD